MISADVLLMTEEEDTARSVQKAVGDALGGKTAEICRSFVEIRSRIIKPGSEKTRRIVIVDIDQQPQQSLYDLSKTIPINPTVVYVVVSQEFSERLVLQAMQAGARHFLRKSTVETDLAKALDHLLLDDPHRAARMGTIVTVFSCSGGCGATTAAVNLAAEMRERAERMILLVDLDVHYGSVAHYLNISGKYGIAHILAREGTIDRHLIESSVVPAGDQMHVLLSPAAASADATTPMNYANLLKTLDACRETHDYIVVDAPRLPPQAVAELATATSVAVIVLRMTVRDVAFARRLIPLLTDSGMAPGRILALANQAASRGPLLHPKDVQRALGTIPLLTVRSDVKRAIKSINQGLPLADTARRSGMRRDYRRVAAQVRRWIANGHPQKGGS